MSGLTAGLGRYTLHISGEVEDDSLDIQDSMLKDSLYQAMLDFKGGFGVYVDILSNTWAISNSRAH